MDFFCQLQYSFMECLTVMLTLFGAIHTLSLQGFQVIGKWLEV